MCWLELKYVLLHTPAFLILNDIEHSLVDRRKKVLQKWFFVLL